MLGAGSPPPLAESEFCVISRRNDSLGTRACWRFFGSLCVVSFGLALGFAAFGAWMVLPYSALEMTVVYLAFRWFERHATDWERLSVSGDRVVVERECAGVRSRREFNRFWVRIEMRDGGFGRSPRLTLRFAGEGVSFGHELRTVARAIVARDLQRAPAA